MLLTLTIKNFILIDQTELNFKDGFTVITGETGAGKSILLDAILFCLGGRFDSEIIKAGAESAFVSANFSLNDGIKKFLAEQSIEVDDELIIMRRQMLGNRKKFLINDQPVTQKTIQQLAGMLLELNSQDSHSGLINPSSHLDIIDHFNNLTALKNSVGEKFHKWRSIEDELAEIAKERAFLDREIDYLSHVTNELAKTNVKIGEEEELAEIRRKLQNKDKEQQLINDLLTELDSSDLNQPLSKAIRIIARSNKEEKEFSSINNHLDQAFNHLEEARNILQHLAKDIGFSQHNLEEIEERLFTIRNLARKYQVTPDELIDFQDKSLQKLSQLQSKIENKELLEQNKTKAKESYFQEAQELSKQRQISAEHLEHRITKELAPLKMEKAVFKVEITKLSDSEVNAKGIDNIRFLASTNPGMPLAPIDKIASGGELSRFMLAVKVALFDKAICPTIIFDEVDTGIGGVVADAVGERLKTLSKAAQVITITHQPQVAGKADQHLLVTKTQSDNITSVIFSVLNIQQRQKELARMLSGKLVTESAMKAANELLTVKS